MRRAALTAVVLLAATACAPVDEPGGAATPPTFVGTQAPSTPPVTSTTPPAAPTGPVPTSSAPGLPSGEHTVVYHVGGSATSASSISYLTGDGQEQQTGVRLPWKRSLKVHGFASASLSAQNAGGGSITCSIDVDGKTVKRSSSSGQYAVVSCVATIGF